jgi:hypothetical protein
MLSKVLILLSAAGVKIRERKHPSAARDAERGRREAKLLAYLSMASVPISLSVERRSSSLTMAAGSARAERGRCSSATRKLARGG